MENVSIILNVTIIFGLGLTIPTVSFESCMSRKEINAKLEAINDKLDDAREHRNRIEDKVEKQIVGDSFWSFLLPILLSVSGDNGIDTSFDCVEGGSCGLTCWDPIGGLLGQCSQLVIYSFDGFCVNE